MKKENLIAQLEGAKALSSQVDIDKVIALLQQLEPEQTQVKVAGISRDLVETIGSRIERVLDYNAGSLVDMDSVCFELNYDNRIEVTDACVDVHEIQSHISAVLEEFVIEEDEPEDDDAEEGTLTDINQGLGLEPGGNPYAE